MKHLKLLVFALVVHGALFLHAAQDNNVTLARYPSLNPNGDKIAFSYQGDIWTVNIDGTNPKRLTVHRAYDFVPHWNSDGSFIAFSSNRFGNSDVYVIPANGGESKRLTYHSANDIVTDWNPKIGILFSTVRNYRQIEWDSEIHAVKKSGGTPKRILDALGSMATVSPDGRFIAFVRGSCRITREQYRGPANKDVWLFDMENSSYIRVTNIESQEIYPRWGDKRTLFYLSASSGRYNIFKVSIKENGKIGPSQQITHFIDDGIRYFDINTKKNVIVFERKTGIYTADLNGSNVQLIPLNIKTDYRFDPVEHKNFTDKVTDYAVSPNGKYTALVIHGEIFITENNKEIKRTVNISNSPWRDQSPAWLNDTTLVFVSDRNGQYDIFLVESADTGQTDLMKTLKRKITRLTKTKEDESSLVASPDGKKLAFLRGRGKLIVADIVEGKKLKNETILLNGWATPGSITWSPDSKWLAYSLDDLDFNKEIFIHAADNSMKPVNISMHPRGDFGPVWSPDGKKLAFYSLRNNMNNDIWFVWLEKRDWEKTAQDWKEEEESAKTSKKKEKKKEKIPQVKIDFKDIHERLVQVTSLPGDEYDIAISKDGKTFYFTAPNPTGKGRDLFSVNWDGKKLKQITKGGQNPSHLSFDHQGKYLYMLSKGRLNRLQEGKGKTEGLPFLAKMDIDHRAEREQIFEEAWRTLNNGFYDPNFHGRNWTALKKKYKPWAMAASTQHDFRDVFNIMLGQLDASHMGMYGKDQGQIQKEITGLLGVEITPEEKGVRVVRVIPNSPADKTVSKLFKGDLITEVNGHSTTKDVNFYSLFINTAGEKILLSVIDKNGKKREVTIRPVQSIRSELYNEWVKKKRALTDKLSNGRLGYLHIQGMNMPSFERFERDFTAAASGKEGIVIDVRYNGGGWTTDYLMAVLNVKQHAYTIPRGAAKNLQKEHKKFRDYYPYAERLPFFPWMKPSIAICNESSYSNAEIFSHAYKTLGIGTLVGEPTFGAVISTGGKRLIDGSFARLPFRAWYVKATDKNMEYGPAIPDIIVQNGPECKAMGKDPQLETAVKILLNQIDKQKK